MNPAVLRAWHPWLAREAARQSDRRVRAALDGWRAGVPRHEMALLNRLTQLLAFPRKSLLVSSEEVVRHRPWPLPDTRQWYRTALDFLPAIYELHARGRAAMGQKPGTDAYGADFAITVDVPGYFLKTAFVQLKAHGDRDPHLERRQLEDAQRDQRVWERSYVAAAHTSAGALRVSPAEKLLNQFPTGDKTHPFKLSSPEWRDGREWTESWLRCDTGPVSQHGAPGGIEEELEDFRSQIADLVEDDPHPRLQDGYPYFLKLSGWYYLWASLDE